MLGGSSPADCFFRVTMEDEGGEVPKLTMGRGLLKDGVTVDTGDSLGGEFSFDFSEDDLVLGFT